MTSSPDAAPLADTLWRLGAVMPWFGGGGLAELAEPSHRYPIVLAMLRSMQQEQRDALQGALTMVDTAVRHALHAGQRLMAARDPVEVMVAQTGLALAVGELAGAPDPGSTHCPSCTTAAWTRSGRQRRPATFPAPKALDLPLRHAERAQH